MSIATTAARVGWAVCLLAFTLELLPVASAQENSGSIRGAVLDASGAGIPAAKLVLSSPTVPGAIETTSDAAGNYAFTNVPIAVYSLTVTKEGFQTLKQQNVDVRLGAKVDFSPKMSLGQVSTVLEVAESAISLDVTSSRTSTNISASEFDALAKGRNFASLLNLTPGLRPEPKSGTAGVGGLSVDGASGAENVFIIDGVDTTNVMGGELRRSFNVPFEVISEFQVKSGGFEAEFGGATGGVINVATRAGSNSFHGQGIYQVTTSDMNPRARGFWRADPSSADLANFFAQVPKDNFTSKYPGFIFGGPLIPNRLFFSTAYFPELRNLTRPVNYTSGARNFKQRELQHYGLQRIDYDVFSKLKVNTSWTWSPFKRNGNLPNSDPRIAAPSNDLSIGGGFVPAQGYSASATYTPTSNLVIQARYGYQYYNDKLGSYGLPTAPFISYNTASTAGGPGVPSNVAGSVGFANVSSTLQTLYDITKRNNLYLDATLIKNLGGQQHSFKFGYLLNRLDNNIRRDYVNGRFTINWGDTFNRGSVNNQKGQYGYYTWEDGVKIFGAVNSRNQGFYFQDAWRVRKNITLNVGMRIENEFLPPYRAEQGGVKIGNPINFGWGDKIAPRIGGAWDLFGDGKWKVTGFYGSFFDVMKYNLARGSFGGEVWVSHVYKLDNPNVFGLSATTPGAGGAEITKYDNRTVPINAQGVIDGVEPDIKPYKQNEVSFSLERQVSSRSVFSARYVHKRLINTIEDIGVLDAEDNEVYLIGNPGHGLTRNTKSDYGQKTPNGQEFLVPQATRNYDALEFNFRGQGWRGTYFNASYIVSRLFGNYSGTANSDENGRQNPNNDRSFDLPYYYFDASGSQKNVFGRLATDRPNTFKLYLSKTFKNKLGEWTIAPNQNVWQGTPLSTSLIYLSAPTYPYGRGDLGRTPTLTQTDVSFMYGRKIGERVTARFEANVINALNQAAVLNVNQTLSRQTLTDARLPLSQFFKGYNPTTFYNVNYVSPNPRINPNYNRPISYQGPRDIRIGLRLIF